MSQSDVFSLIFVASVGMVASFFICQGIIGDPDEASVSFTTIRTPISETIAMPESEIFNSTAINPTIEVYVGDCEDKDNNGILDEDELVACGRLDASSIDSEDDSDGEGGDSDEDVEDSEGE